MKKNKVIVGIIATICNIPLSLTLASIIHIQLSKIDVPRTLYDISQIVADKKFLPLFFLMFSLFEVLIFAMLVVNKNTFYSELDSITDKIKTPKSIGQGQHGTSRWQTQKEFEKNFKCNKLPIERKRNFLIRILLKLFKKKQKEEKNEIIKGGLVVGYKKTKKAEEIYFVDDNIHSLTVGATRSGKTRSVVLQTIGNLALAGESMILSDPKRRAV